MQNISNVTANPFGYTVKKPAATELAQPDGGVRMMDKLEKQKPEVELEGKLKAGLSEAIKPTDNSQKLMINQALNNKTAPLAGNYTNKSTASSETSGIHFDMLL